jgi:hypothetical protein
MVETGTKQIKCTCDKNWEGKKQAAKRENYKNDLIVSLALENMDVNWLFKQG